MYAYGNLRIVVESDLGHLGPKEGQPAAYYWNPLYSFMGVLLWIPLILAFVLLRENRRPAALWILLPAAGFLAAYHIVASLTGMPTEFRTLFLTAIYSMTVGFCLVWLLALRIGGHNRFITALLALLIFAAMTLLTLPSSQADETLEIMVIFPGLTFAVYTIAFTVTVVLTRKRMTGLRFGLWMIPGCLIGTAIPFSAVIIIQSIRYSWPGMIGEFLLQTLAAAGFYYAVALPFVILFFTSGFWRQRFEAICLRKKIQPAGTND